MKKNQVVVANINNRGCEFSKQMLKDESVHFLKEVIFGAVHFQQYEPTLLEKIRYRQIPELFSQNLELTYFHCFVEMEIFRNFTFVDDGNLW